MNRMAALTGGKHVEADHPHLESPLPDGVRHAEVSGSLFFGAAEKAMSALHDIGPAASGAHRYRSVNGHGCVGIGGVGFSHQSGCRSDGVLVAVAGVHGQPALLKCIAPGCTIFPANCYCRPVGAGTGASAALFGQKPRRSAAC
ncbi:MAG: hypothetical protein R3F36_06440 [Candidatus Competibacteraceae bacterium]